MNVLKHLVDGKQVDGHSNESAQVYNPATGQLAYEMPMANIADVKQAIAAAKKAFESWQHVTPSKRAHLMYNYRDLLYKHHDELAELVSREHGKTFDDAKGEVARGIEVVEFCTAINSHLKSDFSADVSTTIDSYNVRQPLGVCVGITPFNFPAMVPMWMFPVAVACGNTFILKPSDKDPGCSLRICELFLEAGFPPGVLNALVCDLEAAGELLRNDEVKAISFVGSTAVGEYIYHEGCKHNKRVQALCGAKNHMVVMPDADLDQVCNAALGSAYGSAGERCMAISVLVIVGKEMADRVVETLSPMVKRLKIGQYDEPGVEMGPVISQQNKDKIVGYIEQGLEQGATLVVDGRSECKREGFFVGGCLFDNVSADMSIYTDEIFGPVLSVVRVDSYQEALQLVDSHEYANGTAIFTRDGDTARHYTMNVGVGMVGVNVPIPVPVAMHSFGGWKRSLFGGSSIHGMEGVRFYTQLKTITARWPSGMRDTAQFNFVSGKEHK